MKIISQIIVCLLFSLCAGNIYSKELPFSPTDEELKALPLYCTDKIKTKNHAKLRSVFGKDFLHLHHYCFGMNFYKRANNEFKNKNLRIHYLGRSEANYNYIIEHTSPEFVLRPEVYVKAGKTKEMQNEFSKAAEYYIRAINEKPDYSKSYVALSILYKRQGNIKGAVEILEQGLKVNPKSKKLKRQLKRIVK